MKEHSPSLRHQVPLYIACYLLWFGFTAVTIWTVFQWRSVLLGLLTVVGPWVIGAIDKFGFIVFMLAAVAWIIYLETYLREGVDKGTFRQRALRAATIQAIALGAAYGLLLLDSLI